MITNVMLLGGIWSPRFHVDLEVVAVLPSECSISREWKDGRGVGPKARLNKLFIESIDPARVATYEFVDILLVE
jgi:hypothetical protein